MSCKIKPITNCFNLRREFIHKCIAQKVHTHTKISRSSGSSKMEKKPSSLKSKSSDSKTHNSERKADDSSTCSYDNHDFDFDKTSAKSLGPKRVW